MRLRGWAPVAMLVAIAIAVSASCLVDRVTSDYACEGQSDCTADRICDSGYCVVPVCPSECSSCSVAERTCQITCNNANRCGAVTCPDGYDCTISCTATGACDSVNCRNGTACDITCSSNNACGNITCGTGACDVKCTTPNACDAVACGESCACDVTCADGNCGGTTCPAADTCTVDGTPATVCESSVGGCNTCQ